jgi:hypothetical protein
MKNVMTVLCTIQYQKNSNGFCYFSLFSTPKLLQNPAGPFCIIITYNQNFTVNAAVHAVKRSLPNQTTLFTTMTDTNLIAAFLVLGALYLLPLALAKGELCYSPTKTFTAKINLFSSELGKI